MKVLVCLSRFPYPLEKGDKLRAYYQIRELSKERQVYLVCLSDQHLRNEDIKELEKYCVKINVVKLGLVQKLFNLAQALFSKKPFQVHYFTSSKMKAQISSIISKERIDLCYVQMLRLGNNIPFHLPVAYYIDYMDALSQGMKKRIHFSRWYEKAVVTMESNRLRAYEESLATHFQGYSIITRSDAEAFSQEIQAKMAIIPNGVSEEYFEVAKQGNVSKEYDVIFTGNMGYHPNVQACKYLVVQVLPLLKKRGLTVKICLAGVNPSPEVMALKSEEVVVTGFVDDIKEYLVRSRIFVAPMFSGSGLQNKLLEAMAAGLPTITSPIANLALGAAPDKEIIVSENPEAFADAIAMLLNETERAQEMGALGQAFIRAHYNWSACNEILEKEFEKIVIK